MWQKKDFFFECPLSVLSKISPYRIILDDGQKRWSCLEWNESVDRVSVLFKSYGFFSGDRVVLIDSASFFSLTIILALWRFGVVVCPLSHHLTKIQREKAKKILRWKYCWTHSDVQAIYEESLHKKSFFFVAQRSVFEWATMLSSSGTSGKSRYVIHNHSNHFFSAKGVQKILNISKNSVWGLSLPLYHIGGFSLLYRCLTIPLCLKICQDSKDWRSLLELGLTHLSLVPTQLKRVLEDSTLVAYARKLKAVVVGGAALSKKILKEAKKEKIPVFISYGCTEAASQVCTLESRDSFFSLKKGKNPFIQVCLNKDGEILLKGKALFQGYWTEKGIEPYCKKNTFFASGDIAEWMDKEKKVFRIQGRKDSMLISGGENIYPEEIEEVLLELDFILRVKISSYNDEKFGQRFFAFIDANEVWDEEFLKQHLRSRLEKFKIPNAFYDWSDKRNCNDKKINWKKNTF